MKIFYTKPKINVPSIIKTNWTKWLERVNSFLAKTENYHCSSVWLELLSSPDHTHINFTFVVVRILSFAPISHIVRCCTVVFPTLETNRLLALCSVAVQNELALAQGRFHSRPPLTERCGAVSAVSRHTALFIHPARSAVGPQPDL